MDTVYTKQAESRESANLVELLCPTFYLEDLRLGRACYSVVHLFLAEA